MSRHGFDILVCSGPECAGLRHADSVYRTFVRALDREGLHERVELGRRKCFGRCQRGPNVYVRARDRHLHGHRDPAQRPRSALYNGVGEADVDEILTEHVGAGTVVTRLIQRADEQIGEPSGEPSGEPNDSHDDDRTDDNLPSGAAHPAGGDPTGTGRDVRLAVAMRALDEDTENG